MSGAVETPEDARQRADLDTPPGGAGSGRVRYAAAMHFYNRGTLSDEALEIYRILALIDAEDPALLLARPDPRSQQLEMVGREGFEPPTKAL